MKVAAFAIHMHARDAQFTNRFKLEWLSNINQKVLKDDYIWHFFLDPNGITLRCQSKFVPKVKQALKVTQQASRKGKEVHITFKQVKDFDPSKDEYQFIRFVGDELQLVFHATSLMALKYPREVFKASILERLNHVVINQTGQHNFKMEAEDYIDAAYGRAALQGRFLSLPRWLHKFIIRRLFTYEK